MTTHVGGSGPLFTLTNVVSPQFGGMTRALLQRSCQIASATGREVVIVTVGRQDDLEALRVSLHDRGLLVDGVSLVNMWHELESAAGDVWDTAEFDPRLTAAVLDGSAEDVEEIRRPDNSILARIQRRTSIGPDDEIQSRGVRRCEIYDQKGDFVGGWRGLWSLWRWWLGEFLPPSAQVVVDAVRVADCLAGAPLPDISVTHVVHGNHLSRGRDRPYGRLGPWRSFTLIRIDRFDAVVFLTQGQRADVDLLFGRQDNTHVIPNAYVPSSTRSRKRPPGRGIVVASLAGRKRVHHAVRAISMAARTTPSVALRIFGKGPDHESVRAEIAAHEAPAQLEGFTSDAPKAFSESSYLLLTSISEGLPLVLVESMAAGCLPIAYDIPYGPSDIISDGVDGFLVPPGDITAMADRITRTATLSRRRLRRMGKAARRRAVDFIPAAIVPRWEPVLEAAAARSRARPEQTEPSIDEVAELERLAVRHRAENCRLDATVTTLTWDERGVASLVVSCTVVDSAQPASTPDVTVELVHRPTGTRSTLPTVTVPPSQPTATPDPTTTMRITLDPSRVEAPTDHVLVARARLGEVDVIDTVQCPTDTSDWLPGPIAFSQRPVLLSDRRGEVRLVTATPKVAARVELAADGATLDVEHLGAGGKIEAVEAMGLAGSATIPATVDSGGRHHLVVTAHGRWKIRARVDGRWRAVAWQGSEPVPTFGGPLRVELSQRGYLRLHREET